MTDITILTCKAYFAPKHTTPYTDNIFLEYRLLKEAYGRVDIVWDDQNRPMVSELEIFEPELWVRNAPWAAENFAKAIAQQLSV